MARTLIAAQAVLGECALWCEREQALFWTDIDSARLSRWCAADGDSSSAVQQWAMPERLGSFALSEDAGGRETPRLPVPASQPTCPGFGGAALDRLFLTSARRDITDEDQAGDVFQLPATGYRGLPAHRFCTP